MDPLADKILLVTAYVILASRGHLPSWLTVIVISRDFLILLGVLILSITRSEFTIKPSVLSKITTCLQLVTVFVALTRGHLDLLTKLDDYFYWLTAALTIASCLHYMRAWFTFVGGGVLGNSTGKEQGAAAKPGKFDDTA
jgi:cardiolipin synthase